MIRLSASVDGGQVFDRAFNRLDSLSDFRPIWPSVIAEFYAIETEQFETEGAAGGQRWTPLSPVYSEYKERVFPGQPILQAEGDLRASLTDPEAAGAILQPREDELVIGTNVPYALVHQRGSSRRNIPRRPPINFSEAQKRRIQKAIQAGLVRFVREAGFDVQERVA
jgi:phage gpG-like protein